MGLDFDWTTTDGEHNEAVVGTVRTRSRSWRIIFIGFGAVAVLALLLWAGYLIVQRRALAELEQAASLYQQLQRQAINSRNGELFQSINATTPAWLSTQLQPRSWQVHLQNPQVNAVQAHHEGLMATLQWPDNAAIQQRYVFFTWRNNALIQAPIPIDYWGDIMTIQQPWGRLTLRQVDQPWAAEIARFTSSTIETLCNASCREDRLPFSLTIRSSLSTTAAPRQVVVPSPRLLALDSSGAPAPLFWQELERQLYNQLTSAQVQFAAPQSLVEKLQRLAAEFMVDNPAIQVEIVALETLPQEPDQLLSAVDGAFLLPTVPMITSGLIHDLSDFAASDPQIEEGDFDQRIWQAAHWNERLWMLPQSTTMRIFFYNRAAVETIGFDRVPTEDWARFTRLLTLLQNHIKLPNNSAILFDGEADLLAAYVAHLHCPERPSTTASRNEAQQLHASCMGGVESASWAEGLAWYKSAVVEDRTILNLSGTPAKEREYLALQIKSLPLRAVLWPENPASFEHYQELHRLGIVPLPGAAGARTAPLRIHGSVISQQADNPQAVWQWINHLTFERPLVATRDIPARRSVAAATNFWATLPEPLQGLMQEEFEQARPVLLQEAAYLEWQNLEPLMSGESSANELAQQLSNPEWFTYIDRANKGSN